MKGYFREGNGEREFWGRRIFGMGDSKEELFWGGAIIESGECLEEGL